MKEKHAELSWMNTYYGARYYNPRESVWLSVDPLSGYNPMMEIEYYIDGQHNGRVYNSFNLNTYGYCYQSPIILIDSNGKQVWTRILGGVKAVGGALEMVAGGALLVTPEPTMATKAAGVVVAVHGADVASSGLKQVWTGEEESSLTSQGLQAAGMSKQNAEIVDASIIIVGKMGAGALNKLGIITNASTVVNQTKKEMTTVGSWMSQQEYNIMSKTGQMVVGVGGQTFVSTRGSNSFTTASKGSVYAEFQVPTNSLIQGGKEGWFKVIGPNAGKSMQLILQKQGGELLPKIENLSPILKIK